MRLCHRIKRSIIINPLLRSELYPISDLACFLPKYAYLSGHTIKKPDLGFTTAHCAQDSSLANEYTKKYGVNANRNRGSESPRSDFTMLEARHDGKFGEERIHNAQEQRRPTKRKGAVPLNPFQPDRDLLPAYNPPHERWVERFPFLAIFRALWKVNFFSERNVSRKVLRI